MRVAATARRRLQEAKGLSSDVQPEDFDREQCQEARGSLARCGVKVETLAMMDCG